MGRRLITLFIAAMIAMLAAAAYAEEKSDKAIEEERRTIDDAYKASVERAKSSSPTQAVDPWGNVREAAPPQKKPKPVTAETKPGH